MINKLHEINDHTKHILDGASLATVMGTLMNWLPAVAALFSIVWTAIRIWETKTVQSAVQKWKK